ncbi:msr8581 [Mesorhizobium japonicum MAFF 303099]|uniref:Msr8581 protein n=1 Tax=Mesorhizobium japonicum (strain LMG 29417 / CECT 9101 / MAFF 303099) TaxID=266835 RepID=Q98NC8_RHILO|nr:msr8581 [Mesorhizobium japonicum MAFF 303099]
MAMQDHGDAVADQKQVDMRVEQAGDGIGVGGQADQRDAALTAANQLRADANVGGRQFRGQSSPPSAHGWIGYPHGRAEL